MFHIDDNMAVRFLAKDFDDISVKPSHKEQSCSILESNDNLYTSSEVENGHIPDFLQCNQQKNANFEGDVGTNIGHNITENMYPSPKNLTSDNKENLSTSTGLGNIDIPESSSSRQRRCSLDM
ncbi:hypothetical protein RIF29_38823 [Crotalaria pallida]|uniref:Uncharacterized protein n=1 Tax=Crotalaria pallida TaxID=3830 RepID=A0AAN9HQ36_CROPI